MSQVRLVGDRFEIADPERDLLGRGGMGAVYRATDRLTGSTVALKRVTTLAEQRLAGDREGGTDPNLSLAREFRTLASLRHPYIISVLDYGFDRQGCPFYTMTYLEGARTIVEAGQGRDRTAQVDLLVRTVQALAYLHRRGVLHRDLKPGNVLVANGQVKVLDFGMSVVTSQTMEYITHTTVGTLAYIAPELFQGAPVTRAADLYAVGVMAYEMFAGRHPFDLTNMATLMYDVISRPADVRSIGLGDDLVAVLERLLAKRREERYDDAEEVIRDLCAATGCALPPETAEIRESYLQAARFVGREAELERLSVALDAALAGRGSAWLVGGESGVGKSRLVEELRTLALVRGATVLRGQAVSEGGSPYHLWRDVLRRLALTTDLEPEQLGVLKPLVPDIAALVGREVPDVPSLGPREMQIRLSWVVGEALRRQDGPLMVILEGLQWAGSESLALLERLTRREGPEALLLIGTYRDDESPHLPERLPAMQVLKLERLSKEGIAALSASMMGEAGRQEPVLDLLQRESEGNPFFLVEVVRALAEEAGQLEQVGAMTLPSRISAAGLEQLVQRRLDRVPEAARPLLQLAAVVGRELDLDVLRALAPEADLDAWLHACTDVAVLEAHGERWRFAHDKLRDGALEALPDATRPALHRQVAGAIEAVYPGDPERVATLAHLWGVAGDRDKEGQYARLAGQQAVRHSANVEAIGYFDRALELLQAAPDSPERSRQELDVLVSLGVPLVLTKGHAAPEVQRTYARALELSERLGEPTQRFHVLMGLRRFYLHHGELETARELGERLLALAQSTRDPVQLSRAHMMHGETLHILGEFVSVRELCERGLGYCDPRQRRSHLFLYGNDTGTGNRLMRAQALWCLGYPDQAAEEMDELLVLARELNHPFNLVFVLYFGACVHQFRREPRIVRERAEAVIRISREQGFALYLAWGTALHGWALAAQGRAAADAEQVSAGIEQMYAGIAARRAEGGTTFLSHLSALLAEAYGLAGRVQEALHQVDGALELVEASDERFWEAELHRLQGELLLTEGEDKLQVEACFQRALEVARRQSARSLELRAATSLGRLWQKQGRKEEARELLLGIYGWFSEGFDTADLQEARALLEELSQADEF